MKSRRAISIICHSLFASAAGLFLGGMALATLGADLSDYAMGAFSGAGNCAFCHDQWGRGLTDRHNREVSIAGDWRATMMAHSFKDPLWRAVMEAEVTENPGLASLIENKCLTCHAPAARAHASSERGKALTFSDARSSALASEGVGCTLCHQIQEAELGTPQTFSGRFPLGTNRTIFGPYQDPLTMPMQRHVDYTPKFGAHTQDSALCATCHTLFTPVLDKAGNVTGQFPEQVPYLEWRNSDFAREKRHCQDCHLTRLDEPIKISSRPPWLEGRTPFWRHQFVGGNVFMLSLLSENAERLEAQADQEQFQSMIAKSRQQLSAAAKLKLNGKRTKDQITLKVRVNNLCGHKFPTAHPYRRAWLRVTVRDQQGTVLFESGSFDSEGRLKSSPTGFDPHHDEITRPDQTQVYQAVMGDIDHKATWSLMRAANLLKDNRIPPRGFRAPQEDQETTRPVGVNNDDNFQSGCDEVSYRVPLVGIRGRVSVEVTLLYQSVPPEAVVRLLGAGAPFAKCFTELYRQARRNPETVCQVREKF